jgi:parallel beta-helix repeat protein
MRTKKICQWIIQLFLSIIIIHNANLVFAADCGGWTRCKCGDNLVTDHIMDYDLSDCQDVGITIGNNNIMLDCNGHTIDGDYPSSDPDSHDYGIYINGKTGVTVKNCRVREFLGGIYIAGASNNILNDNTIMKNGSGIWMDNSKFNTFSSNTICQNVFLDFYFLSGSDNQGSGN